MIAPVTPEQIAGWRAMTSHLSPAKRAMVMTMARMNQPHDAADMEEETMTTTVTVKTHSWPVAVTSSSHHSFDDGQTRSNGWSEATTFVPADSERTFTVSDTCSVRVQELKEGATSLESTLDDDDAMPM